MKIKSIIKKHPIIIAMTILLITLYMAINVCFEFRYSGKYITTVDTYNLLIMSKIKSPEKNDIVYVNQKNSFGKFYRVVGMPEDIVEVRKYEQLDSVYVNGRLIARDLGQPTFHANDTKARKYYLKNNEYFVLGEDTSRCFDSRHFGLINRNDIKSTVIYDTGYNKYKYYKIFLM